MKGLFLLLVTACSQFAYASDVPTVNADRHTGGIAKLQNNAQLKPSDSPLPLPLKALSRADREILKLADKIVESHATTALLLVEKGEIVYERYKAPATADSPLFSQSMSKSLTAYTIGTLFCSGKIKSLDDRADSYALSLRDTIVGASNIRNLLTMSSGAKDAFTAGQSYRGEWEDIINGRQTLVQVIQKFGQLERFTSDDEKINQTEFRYKALDTYALSLVADGAGGFLEAFLKNYLNPSKLEETGYWLLDKTNAAQTASGASFTARDWVRLAIYSTTLLKNGDECIRKFMQEATSIQLLNSKKRLGAAFKGYGYQTWIADFNGHSSYWWVGYGGQRVGIDPVSEKILVLTSHREDYMDSIYKLFMRWQSNK